MTVARNLIVHLAEEGCEIGYASKRDISWVEKHLLPIDLKRTLQWYWPLSTCQIGPVAFEPVSGIRTFPWTDAIIACDLYPLGFGPSGDVFACDFAANRCCVGFINHGKYGGGSDAREYFQATFSSLASYLYLVDGRRYVPADYYAARDFINFLADESAAKLPISKDCG
jgi:hypothetical protein